MSQKESLKILGIAWIMGALALFVAGYFFLNYEIRWLVLGVTLFACTGIFLIYLSRRPKVRKERGLWKPIEKMKSKEKRLAVVAAGIFFILLGILGMIGIIPFSYPLAWGVLWIIAGVTVLYKLVLSLDNPEKNEKSNLKRHQYQKQTYNHHSS